MYHSHEFAFENLHSHEFKKNIFIDLLTISFAGKYVLNFFLRNSTWVIIVIFFVDCIRDFNQEVRVEFDVDSRRYYYRGIWTVCMSRLIGTYR